MKTDLFSLAEAGFLKEVEHLAELANSANFRPLLKYFEAYPEFIGNLCRNYLGEPFYQGLLQRKNLDFSKPSASIVKIKDAINLAAACDLFAGWRLPLVALNPQQLKEYAKNAIRELGVDHEESGRILARMLNSGDACRVVQLLKLLGWLEADTTHHAQLSLGASGGIRDRYAVHKIPMVLYQRYNALLQNPLPETIGFDVIKGSADNIVLVDNDPDMAGYYRKLNAEPGIHAINLDAGAALQELYKSISAGVIAPRTFVLAFRMDHRMIPDTGGFLRQLGRVIDNVADLVVTIGAGHTVDEFRGRLHKIDELANGLTVQGLSPVKIQWYSGNTPEKQRRQPVFGEPTYATYEILYCRLNKSSLLSTTS